jgi:AcrR family transcriptional regulator
VAQRGRAVQRGPRLARARREPRQERSRAMVERIIAAARTVLLEQGYEQASTNRIAAAAGISPGSFYQYFPDKHAVLDIVIERSAERMRARITDAFMATLDATSLQETVRRNVVALLDAFEENAALLRVLQEQLPRAPDARRTEFTHRIDELVAAFLLLRQRGEPREQLEAAAWVLVRAVENVTVSYVLDSPPVRRETVIEEVTAMLTGYLTSRFG